MWYSHIRRIAGPARNLGYVRLDRIGYGRPLTYLFNCSALLLTTSRLVLDGPRTLTRGRALGFGIAVEMMLVRVDVGVLMRMRRGVVMRMAVYEWRVEIPWGTKARAMYGEVAGRVGLRGRMDLPWSPVHVF